MTKYFRKNNHNFPRENLTPLLQGLNVDPEEVYQKVNELGVKDAARIYGYDVENPDCIKLSGRLLMTWLNSVTPRTIERYIKLFKIVKI